MGRNTIVLDARLEPLQRADDATNPCNGLWSGCFAWRRSNALCLSILYNDCNRALCVDWGLCPGARGLDDGLGNRGYHRGVPGDFLEPLAVTCLVVSHLIVIRAALV